jgi:hypothetical protein
MAASDSVAKQVLSFIRKTRGEVRTSDIQAHIPRASVSGALKRLVSEGAIERVWYGCYVAVRGPTGRWPIAAREGADYGPSQSVIHQVLLFVREAGREVATSEVVASVDANSHSAVTHALSRLARQGSITRVRFGYYKTNARSRRRRPVKPKDGIDYGQKRQRDRAANVRREARLKRVYELVERAKALRPGERGDETQGLYVAVHGVDHDAGPGLDIGKLIIFPVNEMHQLEYFVTGIKGSAVNLMLVSVYKDAVGPESLTISRARAKDNIANRHRRYDAATLARIVRRLSS